MADYYSFAALLFRQLFSRCRCNCAGTLARRINKPRSLNTSSRSGHASELQRPLRRPTIPSHTKHDLPVLTSAQQNQRRHEVTYARNRGPKREEKGLTWKQRNDVLPIDRLAEFADYEMTTSTELARKHRRPKRTKMLMRDFVEDSLYNPHYGYFSSQAVIFNPGSDPFDFPSMNSESDFYSQLGRRYTAFEDALDAEKHDETRQLWHTPTELFRPHYAEAIARYMVSNYKLTAYPYHDLIIYELGAGNGTFMLNVLDHIRRTDPDVYARTQYKIIEISASLASLQKTALSHSPYAAEHISKVQIINKSIFAWDSYIPSPCFVLALEVIDNFAHDVIRWDPKTETPLQAHVLIDAQGEFYQFYDKALDPIAARYLRVRDAACGASSAPSHSHRFSFKHNTNLTSASSSTSNNSNSNSDDLEALPLTHPLRWSRWKRHLLRHLPFAPNLSDAEWIPTRAMQFFDVLQRYFPAHRLVLADFDRLEQAVDRPGGVNAPVVQTRFRRRMVPVGSALVRLNSFPFLAVT